MKPRRHRVSRAAIELIKSFEGYRRKAAQLSNGRWTIGYGHTLTAREGAEVSEDDAEALLLYDLIAVAHSVNEWTFVPLNQNQFDALASFGFNIGLENFRRSGVLKRLNEGALIEAACAMELWRKAEFEGERIVIDALVRRRAAEKALFLNPPEGWPAAPSPVLRPLLDTDAEGLLPRESPASLTASLEGEQVRVLRADEPAPAPVPPEEEAAAPMQVAAEAVAARLQTLFAEPSLQAEPEGADPAGGEESQVAEAAGLERDEVLQEPEPANDAEAAQTALRRERILIDDTAPFEFTPPLVQPLPTQSRAGPLSLIALGVLGLAFFAGGVFWALNARPATPGAIGPMVVGWLAGVAGVGLFSAAVFLLLQRLERRADRSHL